MSNRRDFLKQLGLSTAAIALWTPTLVVETRCHFIVPHLISEDGMERLRALEAGTSYDVIKGLKLGAAVFRQNHILNYHNPDAFYLLGVESYPTSEGGTFEIGLYASPSQDKLGIVWKTDSDSFYVVEDVDHVKPNNAIARLYHLKDRNRVSEY